MGRFIKKYLLDSIVIFLVPLLAVFCVQVASDPSLVVWIDANPFKIIYHYILYFAVINIFRVLPSKIYYYVTAILLFSFTVMAYISNIKLELRGEPLLPGDLLLIKEAVNISSSINQTKGIIVGICVVAVILMGFAVLLIQLPKRSYVWKYNIPVFMIAIIAITALYLNKPVNMDTVFKVEDVQWAEASNYGDNGFTLAFFFNVRDNAKPKKPSNYSAKEVSTVVSEYGKDNVETPTTKKPNVIFIQAEAFWDPTIMKGVTFNGDPLPVLHDLEKNYTSGKMVSPVYGGDTANTEFEVLSGLSITGVAPGVIPFNSLNKPLDSLAQVFRGNGYRATGIHSYYSWFYNRSTAYKNLGFDEFMSRDSFANRDNTNGLYIKDEEIGKKIINEVEASKEPTFIYTVTMQSHGPYDQPRTTVKNIHVTSDLPDQSKSLLETYTNQISETEDMVKSLTDYFTKHNEPTVIVLYGDHLPFLGTDYQVYKDAGFANEPNNYNDYIKLHEVPFVVWDNFGLKKDTNVRMSASFVGSYVLDKIGMKGNVVTDFLHTAAVQGNNVVPPKEYFTQEHVDSKWWSAYSLLQYDAMYGKKYVYSIEDKPVIAKDYGFK